MFVINFPDIMTK